MSYTVYYPAGCSSAVPDHVANDICDREQGRVRAVAFIRQSYLAALVASPITATWVTGILNKDIWVVPQTNGTCDGGQPQYAPGYGDEEERLTAYKYAAKFKDPNYKVNAPFYDAMKNSKDFVFAYVTENLVHICSKPCTITPMQPVADDITSEVVWEVDVKWVQPNIITPVDKPANVFLIYNYN